MNLEAEIRIIAERNKKVEIDKAWETSWFRRIIIMVITYMVALVWLLIINESFVWLKSVVPAAGFLLSTLTMPSLKRWWTKIVFKL